LGGGFLEAVYGDALAVEPGVRQVPFLREVELPLRHKGGRLPTTYRADFLCFNEVIVELKAMGRTTPIEDAQVINYLKATGLETGLLLNFSPKSLEHRRYVISKSA
jgi:GxxExxY protein